MQNWHNQGQKWYGHNTKAEDINKRWQKYTEELYKKDLHVLDNHDGVITQLRDRHPGSQVGLRKHHYEQI